MVVIPAAPLIIFSSVMPVAKLLRIEYVAFWSCSNIYNKINFFTHWIRISLFVVVCDFCKSWDENIPKLAV